MTQKAQITEAIYVFDFENGSGFHEETARVLQIEEDVVARIYWDEEGIVIDQTVRDEKGRLIGNKLDELAAIRIHPSIRSHVTLEDLASLSMVDFFRKLANIAKM
jgi:hypothetical protein